MFSQAPNTRNPLLSGAVADGGVERVLKLGGECRSRLRGADWAMLIGGTAFGRDRPDVGWTLGAGEGGSAVPLAFVLNTFTPDGGDQSNTPVGGA